MKRYLIYITIAAVIGMMTMPALAGKPQSGGGSSIALAADATSRSAGPALGNAVRFRTTVEPLAGWEYPMVAVWCYQDGNGDGIHLYPNDDGDLVFMALDHPSADFVLGGGSSDWKDLGGGAECHGMLYAYGNKGKNQTIRGLASTQFSAAG